MKLFHYLIYNLTANPLSTNNSLFAERSPRFQASFIDQDHSYYREGKYRDVRLVWDNI